MVRVAQCASCRRRGPQLECAVCGLPVHDSEKCAINGSCWACYRQAADAAQGCTVTRRASGSVHCYRPSPSSTSSSASSSISSSSFDGSQRTAPQRSCTEGDLLEERALQWRSLPGACMLYQVGQRVLCQHKGPDWHEAEIVATKSASGSLLHYIHFVGFDRRLDRWVSEDQMRPITDEDAFPVDCKRQKAANGDVAMKVFDPQTVAISKANEEEEKRWIESTKVKNVQSVVFGQYKMDAWYFSPYPEDYTKNVETLLICEFCLKYMKTRRALEKHLQQCSLYHPPGVEIYRDGDLRVFEVDGKKEKTYCQLLCLMAKLFLDHKTLYYDVEPFLFYLVTRCEEDGCHTRGYFSKEKQSAEKYNLSCILTLPPFQGEGYGRFMIQFSYELSKREKKFGKPERPLSDLGLRGYISYWKFTVVQTLLELMDTQEVVSIIDIARASAIHPDDVVLTFNQLGVLRCDAQGDRHLCNYQRVDIEQYVASLEAPILAVHPDLLRWEPNRSRTRCEPSRGTRGSALKGNSRASKKRPRRGRPLSCANGGAEGGEESEGTEDGDLRDGALASGPEEVPPPVPCAPLF
eukprot:GGOE01014670.1.p1 GENE.GGOE01014670.1~~GGOE01014670.1.p1  ORF type:complete len:578 (+),score=120.29 GGOE01014670.1:83-1816(+)